MEHFTLVIARTFVRITRLLLPLILLLLLIPVARAQFYNTGRGPMDVKWRQIKSPHYKLVYPDYFRPTAISMAGFLDTITPAISYGYRKTPQRLPIILYTQNQYSNGEVVWAPKRTELMVTSPPEDTHADLWVKQLTVHEYRHIAQLSSLRVGMTKVVSWLFGEAGVALGMVCVPKWYLEGDATLAETQFSEFGRALQPSFTIGMRGLFLQDSTRVRYRTDKWVAGSFRHYMPDIYQYGYQLVAGGDRYFGMELWGGAVDYAGRYPILITPLRQYLRRHSGMKLRDLNNRALQDLHQWWAPYSRVENDYDLLTVPDRSHTVYANPLPTDQGTLIAYKKDFDRPARFVEVQPYDLPGSYEERRIAWTATPSSRPALKDNVLYWTEYKPHPIWDYRNYSIVRTLDLTTGKKNKMGMRQSNYFVTPLPDGYLATVSPDSLGGSHIIIRDRDFRSVTRHGFREMTSVHGLAWDDATGTLNFIGLDERGMWIGSLAMDFTGANVPRITAEREVTAPSMVTVSGLRADGNGTLYFGSIRSGKDEIHKLELASGRESRLTTSQLGAVQPAPGEKGKVYFTSYTPDGYVLAQTQRETDDTIGWARLPENLLNIPGPKWDVPQMREVALDDSTTTHSDKKYYKGLRWFNVHSWAPISANVKDVTDERNLNLGFGATLFFQSPMSESYGAATYGYLNGDNWVGGFWTYAGLPVVFELEAEYGGGKQDVYVPSAVDYDNIAFPDKFKEYFEGKIKASVPLNFSGGHHYRLLQPSFSVIHYNSLLYEPEKEKFHKGYQKYDAQLWWSVTRHYSTRSVVPRLGYAVRANFTGAFSNRFGKVYSFYARGYVPGFMQNHSITLRAGAMYQKRGELNFNQKPLFPRGAHNWFSAKKFWAGSFDYTFPAFYPDGGINGVIYFKRIWFNLFADYARGAYFAYRGGTRYINHHSFGGDIGFDLNVFGSVSPMTVKVTLASPSDDSFYVGAGVAFSF